jgi:hypothetical protein
VKANPIGFYNLPQEQHPLLTINRDGSITPQTNLISQNGNTYTLTANITDFTIITIECSGIVFDGDGIGDTPHVIDKNNIDNYPLMYPYDIENDKVVLPIREPVETEPFPVTFVAGVSAVGIIAVVIGLFLYRRKGKISKAGK